MGIIEITKDNYEESIKSKNICIVEFYASWCGICGMLLPVLEELSNKYKEIGFLKVNAEANRALCSANKVLSLPTVMIYKNGILVERFNGLKDINEIEDILHKYI